MLGLGREKTLLILYQQKKMTAITATEGGEDKVWGRGR